MTGDGTEALNALVEIVKSGRIVAVVGPTASGKTALACDLAERVSGEVVSVDSVQVYQRFDKGSGKPTSDELARARHHLVSVKNAKVDRIDAAEFAALANAAIDDIRARGKHPILCGGSFLWMKSLLYGLASAPPADAEVRARHREIVLASGSAELHRQLAAVDPVAGARLHPNDSLRVGRALEVFELTGRTMSALQDEHRFGEKRHDAELVARRIDPAALTERITRRVVGWLEEGWVDEVRTLALDGYGDTRPMQSVGYREVFAHLKGEIPSGELVGAIVRSTRVFARRQRTWLGSVDVRWLETPLRILEAEGEV